MKKCLQLLGCGLEKDNYFKTFDACCQIDFQKYYSNFHQLLILVYECTLAEYSHFLGFLLID